MKWTEYRQLGDAALKNELLKMIEESRNLRFQAAIGPLENPLLRRKLRRNAARIRTILRERQIQGAPKT